MKDNTIQYHKIKKDNIFKFQSSLQGQISPRSFARILSALKTFCTPHQFRDGILKYIAFLFWGIIPAFFIIIIIAIQLKIIE